MIREPKKSRKEMWYSRVLMQQDVHVYLGWKGKRGEAYKCDRFYITKIPTIEFASLKYAIHRICYVHVTLTAT
jgi:hypothetical protein